MKNNNNKAVGVTPGKNILQLPTWLQCYLISLTSLYISTDLYLSILLFSLEMGCLYRCNTNWSTQCVHIL